MRAVLSPKVLMGELGACDTQVDDVLGLGSLLGGSLGNCPLRMQPGCHKALFERIIFSLYGI